MRQKYFGWAIAAIATLGPMQAWGGDREIAEQIIKRLKSHRDAGSLKDFTLDMKVDNGVVLFRGSVGEPAQRLLVLDSAQGIEGIAKVVDEVAVKNAASETAAPAPSLVKPKALIAANETAASEPAPAALPTPVKLETPTAQDGFSFREALAAQAAAIRSSQSSDRGAAIATLGEEFPNAMPGGIMPAAAMELAEAQPGDDPQVIRSVVSALGQAQKSGQLRGFGVDVKCNGGVVELTGRAASPAQRDMILQIASNTPGVVGVREAIQVPAQAAPMRDAMVRLPEPMPDTTGHAGSEQPAQPSAALASTQPGVPAMTAPYRAQPGQQTAAAGASAGGVATMGVPVVGAPVPMAPYAGVAGAPRYDTPYLPNYAWPGYAAYPNYAAVTYPQQYSPSAWPYIGPFYPYPQVPLGWRKVSLEWDDGWWFLDFTDR